MKRTKSSTSVVNLGNVTLSQYSQTETNKDAAAVIYFVIPEGSTATTCFGRLITAKKLCDSLGLCSEWLEESTLRRMRPKPNNVFVLDPFSGPAYGFVEDLFLKSKNFMVIGPQCLQYVVHRQDVESTMENRGFPFYTMGMRNICVTLTGFQADEQKELVDLVQKMNGIVTKPFALATTHVVAKHVLTPKCSEAFKKDIPVMTADWIRSVWKDSQEEIIDATDKKYIEHSCGIFHGVQICVSQIQSSMKASIEKIIKNGGGSYSKDFKRYGTQVLIVPNASGEKYKFAKQWNIATVTPDWVNKSKEEGHVVPFDAFPPPHRPIYNSTQIADDNDPQFPDANTTAVSVIANPEFSRIENTSRANISVLTAQEAEEIRKDDLEVLRGAADGFLEGCTLYLCNTDHRKLPDLRMILMAAEVNLSSELSSDVTHVVVFNNHITEKESKNFKSNGISPNVVSFEWVLACARQGHKVEEESYVVTVPDPSARFSQNVARDVQSLRNELNASLGLPAEPANNGSQPGRNSGDKMQRNLSQSAFVQPEFIQRQKSIIPDVKEVTRVSETDVDASCTIAEERFVFYGITFSVQLETKEETESVTNAIKAASGEVVDAKESATCDILILPPVFKPFSSNALQSFTKFWVADCIESKSLEVKEELCHTPYEADDNLKQVLKGVVLAMSAYVIPVKEYITKLATFMGAKVQEVFSRRDTKGSLKTTHLLCGVTDNDKYRAAQRWGTPVAGCEWIVECYKQRKRLDHTDFKLDETNEMTVSVYMKTPKTQAEKFRPGTSSRAGCASVLPGTDKGKSDSNFRRPEGRVQVKLSFDADVQKTPKSVQSVLVKARAAAATHKVESPAVESPLLHPTMSREGSRQLKRAIDWAAESFEGDPMNEIRREARRKSTPIDEIMKQVNEVLDRKNEERRKIHNVSPMFFRLPKNNAQEVKNQSDGDDDDGGVFVDPPVLVLDDDEVDDNGINAQQSKRAKLKHGNGAKTSSDSTASSSTGYSSSGRKRSSAISLANVQPNKNHKFGNVEDLLDDNVVQDEGDAAEVCWNADKDDSPVKPTVQPVVEQSPKVLELVPEPAKPARSESPPQREVVLNDRNVKKKRGTGSSAQSCKSSVASSTRSKRSQEKVATRKKYCFSLSGGTVAEKESYKTIITQLEGTISAQDNYDAAADALIATKVARSEKILASIAAGKPILHPSYLAACSEAGQLLEPCDYLWDESHCKTDSEKNMARVARYWYKKLQEAPTETPYRNFRALLPEEKASKRAAYVRLIEAGGGKVVENKEDMNIIIADSKVLSSLSVPSNVKVKIPLFLNDVIINYDDPANKLFN